MIIVLFILYFLFFIFVNRTLIKTEKYKNLILLLFMFLFSFYLSVNVNLISMNIPVHSVSVALIICLFIVMSSRTIKPGKELIYFLPLFFYFGYELVSFRINEYDIYYQMISMYISIFIIILIYRSLEEIDLNQILYSINYLAIFNSLLGIAQYTTGKQLLLGNFDTSILYTEGVVATYRVVGLVASNNGAGNFGALLFGVVLYNFLKRKNSLSFIALILTLIFSALTLTRIGYVAIIIEILIFYFAFKPKSKKGINLKIIIFSIGTPFALSVLWIFSSQIINRLFVERGNTSESRFYQFQRIYEYIIPEHWLFGIGNGQYQSFLYSNFQILDAPIHSQYLNVLAEQGIIFFLMFIFFNFWLIYKIIISTRIEKNLKVLAISIFIGNIICSNLNPNQSYYINNVLYYLIIIGLYFYGKNIKKQE